MNSSREILMGSSGAGSASCSKPKKSAISRNAMYPDRMHSPGAAENGMFNTASRSAAASITVPADVIHERLGLGDRKNGSTASDVWVSDTAENQRIHSC